MKHKIIFGVVVFLLLFGVLFTSFGCATPPAGTTTPTTFVTTDSFNTKMAEMDTKIGTKANQADVTAQASRIDNLPNQSSGLTDAQVRAIVTEEINKIKNDQSWITSATHTTPAGTVAGEYGELLDTDGDLELWLDRVSGAASDELRTRDGKNEARFDFVVVNKDIVSAHDFRIYLEFEPDTDVVLDMAVDKTYATASGSLTYAANRSPNSSKGILRIDPTTNLGRILKGDAEDYTIWLTVQQTTVSSIDWDMSFRIDDRD